MRGDANVNQKNVSRVSLFKHLLTKYSLLSVDLDHPTYHHFLGNGVFDSSLDVLLYPDNPLASESLTEVLCKHQNPLIQSHHDIILSRFTLGQAALPPNEDNIEAPKVENKRMKIIWSDDGIADYKEHVGDNLARLRETWCDPSSPASMSVLLSATYALLSSAAALTNKTVSLSAPLNPKPRNNPDISALQRDLLVKHKALAHLKSRDSSHSELSDANQEYLKIRKSYQQALRKYRRDEAVSRDEKLNSVLTNNPAAIQKSINSLRNSSSSKIHTLHVGDATYVGQAVPDGFYDSLSSLKAPDLSTIHSTSHYQSTLSDFKHILKICRSGDPIPEISPKTSTEILFSLRQNVNDFYSITANHFVNAGHSGVAHFHFLLAALIKNVNLAGLDELNTIWACILYKGHGKDKQSDRSYRTISTCPIIAKALDTYVGLLYGDCWSSVQATTQFQGQGSSHELAALLMTEAI